MAIVLVIVMYSISSTVTYTTFPSEFEATIAAATEEEEEVVTGGAEELKDDKVSAGPAAFVLAEVTAGLALSWTTTIGELRLD